MLSSAVLDSTQGSAGFQPKSEILFVWPPCMNCLQASDAVPKTTRVYFLPRARVGHLLLLREVGEHQSWRDPTLGFFCRCWLWLKQHRGVVTMPIEESRIDELLGCELIVLGYADPIRQRSVHINGEYRHTDMIHRYFSYLISRTSSEHPLTSRGKCYTVDFGVVCLNVVNWLVGVVSSVPAIQYQSLIPSFGCTRAIPTSWVEHRRRPRRIWIQISCAMQHPIVCQWAVGANTVIMLTSTPVVWAVYVRTGSNSRFSFDVPATSHWQIFESKPALSKWVEFPLWGLQARP